MKGIYSRLTFVSTIMTLLALLLLQLFPSLPLAAVINVPADYATIQAAIDAAEQGDEIIVSPATYGENIDFGGKNIILRSSQPTNPGVVATTVIDGNSSDSVVTFSGTELTTCVLSGFTITHGYAPIAGGIMGNGTLATIEYNVITANATHELYYPQGSGGGLHSCHGPIRHNTISGNSCYIAGGGLYECNGTIQSNVITANSTKTFKITAMLEECDGTIVNNTIQQPSVNTVGGGLYGCNGIIENNIIFRNKSDFGGGGSSCDGTVRNNTIVDNSAGLGGGLYWCHGIIKNCILWQNSALPTYGPQLYDSSTPSYSCIQEWTSGGTGNITDDPQLVNPGSPAAPDFHLLPSSPCIDAGGTVALAQDFEGDPRPLDGTSEARGDGSDFDIGADEFYPPTLPVVHFDFESGPQDWTFRQLPPGPLHISHWDHASSLITSSAIGISTPDDETTNYFALWDSLAAETIPYAHDRLYQVDWFFSTDRTTPDAVPSLRFRIGLTNQKAFSYSRVYPGDWLPLAQTPAFTTFTLFFEPPIAADGLFLAFSLVDWTDDFRLSNPAGEVYLEEVVVSGHKLSFLTDWQPLSTSFALDSCTTAGTLLYALPIYTRMFDRVALSSGIGSDSVFGSWDTPTDLFTIGPDELYRLTLHLSSYPQLGGPDLRLRIHTDDYRYAWYSYYASSYTAGESALPSPAGADYCLYLVLPFGIQACHFSFDLVDFSSAFGGILALHDLSVDSRSF